MAKYKILKDGIFHGECETENIAQWLCNFAKNRFNYKASPVLGYPLFYGEGKITLTSPKCYLTAIKQEVK